MLLFIIIEAFSKGNFKNKKDIIDFVLHEKRLPLSLDTPPAFAELITTSWIQNQAKRPTFKQITEKLQYAYDTILKKFNLVQKQ